MRRSRSRGLLAAVLVQLPLVAGALATGAGAAPSAPVDDEAPVRIEVTTLAPRAPMQPDEAFQVTGRLINEGPEPVSELQVRLLVDDVLRTRGQLARAAREPATGRPRGTGAAPQQRVLEPGGTTTFDLRMQVRELGLSRLGVYPVALQVRAAVGDESRVVPVGLASTFVPWFPDGPPRPTRLAWLWPLVDVPRRAPDGAVLGTGLQESLAPGGRLAGLLEAARAGAPGRCDDPAEPPAGTAPPAGAEPPAVPPLCRGEAVPVTYGVDPALLATVATLADEHRVVRADGEVTAEPPSDDAVRWLGLLREALTGAAPTIASPGLPAAEMLALPYADPDIVAMTEDRTGVADGVEQLRVLGRRVAADVAGELPVESVAWPPPGPLTSAALDATVAGGATAVVLREDALAPRAAGSGRTPGTRTELSSASAGPVTGLVVEEGLSALLAAGPDGPGWQGERLAEQRWIAETAMIAAERPGESRTLLVAPPRRGEVQPDVAGTALLDSGRLPWLCAVAVVDVVAGTERCPDEQGAAEQESGQQGAARPGTAEPGTAEPGTADPRRVPEDRGELQPPARDGTLSPALLGSVAQVQVRADQLTDFVLLAGTPEAEAVAERFLRARARTLSSAWRSERDGARRMLALFRDDVDGMRSQVQLVTSGTALLTSRSGVIDVLVSNGLEQPVTVGIDLNDPIEARLTSTDTATRTIGPLQQVPVRVQVETRTSGRFVVEATLLDRVGRPFGPTVELVARSTSYGRFALTVTGVGAAVLLVAVGVRIARRAMAASRSRQPGG